MRTDVLDPLDKLRSPEAALERRGRRDPDIERQMRERNNERANIVRQRLDVSAVVGRVVTLKKRNAAEHVGLCPFHNESTPSFTVNDKKGFYHCFGCGEHGDAIGFVMKRQGRTFLEALEILESENGLRTLEAARPAPPAPKVEQREDLDIRRKVERMFANSVAVTAGDPVDRYLRGRAILPPADYGFGDPKLNAGWPIDIRYCAALWHKPSQQRLPGMVAAFRRHDGLLAAVHRTWLSVTDATVTKAKVTPEKMHFGPRKGAFILLGPIADEMVECEGIETTLSFMQLMKRPGFAAGSADALEAVEPPFLCTRLTIGADWSKKNKVGEIRAHNARRKFSTGGRKIGVQVPNMRNLDKADFNDWLVALRDRNEGRVPT